MALALTQSAMGDSGYRFRRPMKASDYRPVPHRWFQVLALHLSGKRPKEVMELTGYSPAMYYRILDHPSILGIRQQLLERVQRDFEDLYPKIVENITNQLNSEDTKVQLEAQNQWLKATGKFAPKQKASAGEELSAEDLVKQLLMQQINVNVNLGGKVEAPNSVIDVTP